MEKNLKSTYNLTLTEFSSSTKCPGCHEYCTLLSSDKFNKSTFYICWGCKRVFEAGKGEVESGKRT